MKSKPLTTLTFEKEVDIKDFAYEFSMEASEGDYEDFITSLDNEFDYSDYTEVLFKAALRQMINRIESCPEDYAGTKWEMLLAMQGLLDK